MNKPFRQIITGLSLKTYLYIAGAGVALLLALYFFGAIKSGVSALRSGFADARSEKIVKDETDAAAAHEANANSASVNRQISEGRAADALAEKEKASANSNLTAEPARRARQQYEKTRRTPVAPDDSHLSDAELCAELARRGIRSPDCK